MSNWSERPAPIDESLTCGTVEADVVVVGLGYSGTAALRACAEGGVDVVGLESMSRENYRSFGRDFGHINSRFLESRGVPKVDPLDLFDEMMRRSGGRANPTLLMKFSKNCGEAFDWFTDVYGPEELEKVHVAFWPNGATRFKENPNSVYNGYRFWNGTAQFPGGPISWTQHPSLTDTVRANQDAAEKNGARLYFCTSAEQLLQDGKKVIGLFARNGDGNYIRFLARRGVILAAGDFAGDEEMVRDLVSDIDELWSSKGGKVLRLGRKGQGIKMGVWAGGRLEPRPLAAMGGNYRLMRGFTTFGVLWLDRTGKRFCNETFGGPELSCFPLTQMPMGTYYSIFDEHVLDDLQWAVPAHCGFDESNPLWRSALQEILRNADAHPCGDPGSMLPVTDHFRYPYISDNIYSGATVEELVENAGLSEELADNVIMSVKRYNELCIRKRDEDFGKDRRHLRPLSGKIYLCKGEQGKNMGNMLVTVGGLVTDGNQNVLDQDYEPIPGLYATGNCCGRRFGMQYTSPISGISIGLAVTLGREAGRVFT